MKQYQDFILASRSPRRIELLRSICGAFRIVPADADETLPKGIEPDEAVRRLSCLKAGEIAGKNPDSLVLGADTVVAIDGKILGKPQDEREAGEMLALLGGRVHTVYTGVTLCCKKESREDCFHVATDVEFYPLERAQIDWYVKTGEPFDKAGGYGIQQKGAVLVKAVQGDFFNVMGFPIAEIWRRLKAVGVPLL